MRGEETVGWKEFAVSNRAWTLQVRLCLLVDRSLNHLLAGSTLPLRCQSALTQPRPNANETRIPYDREMSGPVGPGGARRDRTDDLMLAKHALYQLSYGPAR